VRRSDCSCENYASVGADMRAKNSLAATFSSFALPLSFHFGRLSEVPKEYIVIKYSRL
jgi:hypothetical protein